MISHRARAWIGLPALAVRVRRPAGRVSSRSVLIKGKQKLGIYIYIYKKSERIAKYFHPINLYPLLRLLAFKSSLKIDLAPRNHPTIRNVWIQVDTAIYKQFYLVF